MGLALGPQLPTLDVDSVMTIVMGIVDISVSILRLKQTESAIGASLSVLCWALVPILEVDVKLAPL